MSGKRDEDQINGHGVDVATPEKCQKQIDRQAGQDEGHRAAVTCIFDLENHGVRLADCQHQHHSESDKANDAVIDENAVNHVVREIIIIKSEGHGTGLLGAEEAVTFRLDETRPAL